MSRPPQRRPQRGKKPVAKAPQVRLKDRLTLQPQGRGEFLLVPPACAFDRREDVDEVREMMAEEEFDIARDELLYLVSDCSGFLEAHNLLAELALEDNEIAIARGHFGFAFETVLDILPLGFSGKIRASEPQNKHFFEAGCGLARCLIAQKKLSEGREVLERLTKFDPTDELTRDLLTQLAERESQAAGSMGGTGNSLPILNNE